MNILLKAIRKEPIDRTPIWLMRQAGRYLPEYRRVRKQAGSFMTLCQTPELAAEVTLQPLRRYALDAAIIFSDILTLPDAMGLSLQVTETQGPYFEHPLNHPNDCYQLAIPDFNRLRYVYEAIQLTKCALNKTVPLIGFAGSPFTLAAYMLEGKASLNFPRIIQLIDTEPVMVHHLLCLLADAVALHLYEQIKAGVDVVMIFDSWGGLLSPQHYCPFSLQYIQRSLTKLKTLPEAKAIPIILFAKGVTHALESIAHSGCDMIGIDWTLSLHEAHRRIGNRIALQGNLDPSILLTDEHTIRSAVQTILDSMEQHTGHVFNLGHGVLKETPPDNISLLIDAVHTISRQKRGVA